MYTEIKDFSSCGLCIKTESVIKPGSAIKVKFDKHHLASKIDKSNEPSSTNTLKTYNSIVKWYRILGDDQSVSGVNIGLEFKKNY